MRSSLIVFVLAMVVLQSPVQCSTASPFDRFEQRLAGISLKNENILAGIIPVTRSADLALSIEYPLGEKISGPSPAGKLVTGIAPAGTVKQVLNELCNLDPTFTWIRSGDMVNIVPRTALDDTTYVLNRKIVSLSFENVRNAQDAVFKALAALPRPREQIAILQTGMSLDFAAPWSASFKDASVREVLDAIAQQFGPSYGWEFRGARDFRMITFHESLSVNEKRKAPRN